MRRCWKSGMVALGIAAAAAACGGAEQEDRTAVGETVPPSTQEITLQGCVQGAPGSSEFALRNIRIEGESRQTQSSTTTAGDRITAGSWVRLATPEGSGADLAQYAGYEVTVRGPVVDTGRNTIGTSGTSGQETPSGDKSMAAGDEHYANRQAQEAGRIARNTMANGMAPKILVHEVTSTGERCGGDGGR